MKLETKFISQPLIKHGSNLVQQNSFGPHLKNSEDLWMDILHPTDLSKSQTSKELHRLYGSDDNEMTK